MTGRERIIASLNFKNPDRIPRDLWALPYICLFKKAELESLLSEYTMDIGLSEISLNFTNDQLKLASAIGEYKDDWGSIWYVGEPGVWGEVKKPVLDDYIKLNNFKPPYHLIEKRNKDVINRICHDGDKFMLSHIAARPFERLQFLRGTENAFIDIAEDSSNFYKLLNITDEFYLKDVEWWCGTDVDGILMMDDWGSNNGLLINPKSWRELFKPLYKKYCDMIHSAGKYVFFHSDGNIEEVFGDFIEVGIDAINSQLFAMDLENLSKKYKGKITFWGEIDRQFVLPFGTTEDVANSIKKIRSLFDNGKGGLIAQCEWGKDNSFKNIETVYKTWEIKNVKQNTK
ncbi:MAG: uroporphyrinogen decarboxylase family protein [Candidatus Humimicrobiaceae bacterium]